MAEAYLLREIGGTSSELDFAQQEEEQEKPEKGLFCRFCSHLITFEEHSLAVNGRHHHTFFNPAGIIYEIRCFSNAEGCSLHGPPTDEFTWFTGYIWRLALCASCFSHLGWSFSSADDLFYGLIEQKLAG